MIPYKEASKEIQRQGELPHKLLKTASSLVGTGATAAAGGLALKRVLPLLSSYIPQDLAIKGLSKVDSRFGNFISKAMEGGKTWDEIKGFIEEKASSAAPKEQNEKKLNIIQQYSPELDEFIMDQIGKGRALKTIKAQLLTNEKKTISKIEKDTGKRIDDILEEIYGSGQQNALPNQVESKAALQPQPNNPGQGSSDEAIMAALDKILKM